MKDLTHFPLKSYNTFGMEVLCARFIQLDTIDEIASLFQTNIFEQPHYILGGGSNTLFTKNYDGTIIHPAFKGIDIVEETPDYVTLKVAAGEAWSDLTNYCRLHQLYGIENLVGIPGLVGSSPVQNIGAYGVEVKDCIKKVEGYNTATQQPFVLSAAQCHFGYRNSIFKQELKGKCLITYVWFKLSKKAQWNFSYKALADSMVGVLPSLDSVMNTILHIRDSKLPDITKIGSAGSFFKNPIVPQDVYKNLLETYPDLVSYPAEEQQVKLSAGQLIEKAGWKGKRLGEAGVYPQQALVIVNYGKALPEEITEIYQRVIADVLQKFGIKLLPEVNILP